MLAWKIEVCPYVVHYGGLAPHHRNGTLNPISHDFRIGEARAPEETKGGRRFYKGVIEGLYRAYRGSM